MIGIYKITNKITNKCYIGQSIHIEERFKEHLWRSHNSSIHQAIMDEGLDNFTFEVLEECPQSKLNEREKYWISYYDSFLNGYNRSRGGETGCQYDPEEILKDYLKTNNISQTARNFNCHKNTVRQIIHSYGIHRDDLQQAKPIEQVDPKTLKVIATYDSIGSAARSMGVSISAIQQVIYGNNQSCKGYYFKEKNSNIDFSNYKVSLQKRAVNQIDLQTKEIIATYNSMADAAEALGKDRKNGGSQICAVCKKKKNAAFGYGWEYVNQ